MRFLSPGKYAQTMRYLWLNSRNRAGGVVYPFYASLKVSQTCNFKCRFCEVWRNPSPGLPTEDLKTVIDNLGRSSVFLLTIEGGEPLLRPDIFEILQHIRKQDVYLLLVTSERGLRTDYPMRTYCKYIDFLHISIDEGHGNLEMFDELEEFVAFHQLL